MLDNELTGYTISRRLADGGMTTLSVGVNTAQERVVIRRIRPEFVSNLRVRGGFERGAAILARLNHPNVVRLIKSGVRAHPPYMVIEYVDGESMRGHLLHRSALLKLNPLSIMRQMAAGLNYVHSAGFLHLDFKPDNLVLQNDGRVVIVDFDLAMDRKPKPVRIHPLPGTFAYLPPETLNAELVDERTDIYAFGVTCYELFTGHKPFEGLTPDESKRLQLDPSQKPKSFHNHNVSVPARIERLIFKCLAHQHDDRYPSMSLVQRDIETLV